MWSQRSVVDIKRHEYIFIQFVLQTNTLHKCGDQHKGQTNKHIVESNRHKRLANWCQSTSPSSPSDLWEPWSNFENWNDFQQSELFLALLLFSVRRARKWKFGIVYNNTGMHWSAFCLFHWWQRNFEDAHKYRLIRASCITMAYQSLWGNV